MRVLGVRCEDMWVQGMSCVVCGVRCEGCVGCKG